MICKGFCSRVLYLFLFFICVCYNFVDEVLVLSRSSGNEF